MNRRLSPIFVFKKFLKDLNKSIDFWYNICYNIYKVKVLIVIMFKIKKELMKLKGLSKEDKIKLGYDLDLKNSYVDYVTQTEKQYFYYALDYAIKNGLKSVKVNRIKFLFNFEKLEVMIGINVDKAIVYKRKKI